MKLTIYKKVTMLTPIAFAASDPNVTPPPGFKPCATVECEESERMADVLSAVEIETDAVIKDSPHVVATRIVSRLTMRAIPFRMAFEG